MSMSISGSSGSIPDRQTHIEPVARTQKTTSTVPDTTTQAQVSSQIQTVAELKQAEMRGEHYTISDQEVVRAVDRAIKAMQGKSTSLQFSIHEQTKLIAVKVLDKETGEVIREVPPEKTLDFVAKLWEMAGILVDEKR
ncbi:flagellar protein FlaG [Paenibacillus aurantiacus]|uniref:Flagellar protein FlaG n=1 Tax=Paenibacillus aurantiacus TaxID=1936118 RepID=A0ABV5KXE1_9BACL